MSPSGDEQGEMYVFTALRGIEQLRDLFGFILLLFGMNIVMGYLEKAHTCF